MFARQITTLLCSAGLLACTAQAPPPKAPPPAAPAAPAVKETQLHAGVTALDTECDPQAEELCDALDQNCDGVIDEGCGYETGGVQVTVAWDSPADIDLYVKDPSGEAVFYNRDAQRSPVGGELDHNARGECRSEDALKNVENAHWPEPAPRGRYEVELHYFGPCGDVVETHVTVSVAVGGKVAGVYRYSLSPDERVTAVTFDVD